MLIVSHNKERIRIMKTSSLKEKLQSVLGGVGIVLFYILVYGAFILTLVPLLVIDAPAWVIILIGISDLALNMYAVIFEPIVYIWALVIVLNGGVATWLAVLFWIFFVLWLIRFIFAMFNIITTLIGRFSSK